MEKDLGGELRRMFQGDDQKAASIEAAKLLSTKDANLSLKTDIPDPLYFAAFKAFGVYLKSKGMTETAKTIKSIMEAFEVYMVSHDRKGRQEIIDVFKAMEEKVDQSWKDNMFKRSE